MRMRLATTRPLSRLVLLRGVREVGGVEGHGEVYERRVMALIMNAWARSDVKLSVLPAIA